MKRRVDDNQDEIVMALREIGCSVQSLASVGSGCPDLLVAWKGEMTLLEVKNPKVPKSDQQLTPLEKTWHEAWKGRRIDVVYTIDDAIAAVTGS